MVPQFIHEAQSSFMLWFEHHLLEKGRAFSNETGKLFYGADTRIPSVLNGFSSQYKQWVADSSISGANISSGIYVGANFSGRSNGIIVDYDNGRVLASGLSTSSQPTGAFAVKEFNVYATNENLEDLIVEKKYFARPKVASNLSPSGIPPYAPVVPAIFINSQTQENEPFSFGGEDKTTVNFSATVICDTPYKLDGVLGLFSDTNEKVFAHIPFTQAPYNEFGDLKSGYYHYGALSSGNSNTLPFVIEKVRPSKITDKMRRSIENTMYIGLLDFEVSKLRYPRQ